MRILIAQPKQEENPFQLISEIENNPDVDVALFPEGYIKNKKLLDNAKKISKQNEVMIITGYIDENKKDRAIIINKEGTIILDRAKTPVLAKKLIEPVIISQGNENFGYILCMEILKGLDGFSWDDSPIKFIAHPIGTGMFSEEQFEEWIEYARAIAIKYKCYIIGTSHADGSYKNCGLSIPIAYCINSLGKSLFISKSDTRTRIMDLQKNEVKIIEASG